MSMLAGATLLVSALFGTGAPTAQAVEVPAEFGTDWHDPMTAAPPVDRPHSTSCRVTLADAQFRDFTPYRGTYTPPEGVRRPLEQSRPAPGRQGEGAVNTTGSATCTSAGSRSCAPPRRSPHPTASRGTWRRTSPATATPSAPPATSRCSSATWWTTRTPVSSTSTSPSPSIRAVPRPPPPTVSSPSPTRPPVRRSPPRATANGSSPRCTRPVRAAGARSSGT